MHSKTILQAKEDLRQKKYSAVELTEAIYQRIDKVEPKVQAYVHLTRNMAIEQAQKADQKIAAGQDATLLGIPIALKDLICMQNTRTTCSSQILDQFVAPYDATVVSRLKKVGAVIVGKTNMDEFAMGSSTETSWFGPTRNPWNQSRVAGGSSGGSAAAVAARLVPVATGTDTGGSIRQPAAFCGLTGLKPSYGRVSRYGMIAYASSLDQGGPIAQSAEDAALLLQVMAGFDPRDATSLDKEVPDYTSALNRPVAGLTIGLPKEFFDSSVDESVRYANHAALMEFEKLGARLIDISLPNSSAGIPCFYVIAPAEASSNLSRFDGVRYGYRTDSYRDLNEMYEKTRAEGFGIEVKRRIMIGTFALSAGYYDAYYRKAQQIRQIIANDFREAFRRCDYIAGPTSPTPAFALGEKTNDPVSMYLSDIFTITANLAGIPAISIPVGFDNTGLPIGLQLTGQSFDESGLLNLAHRYQQVTDWHQHLPKDFS